VERRWAAISVDGGATILVDPDVEELPVEDEAQRWQTLSRFARLRAVAVSALASGAWFFVLLAAAQFVLLARSLYMEASAGYLYQPATFLMLCSLVSGPALTLLPAWILFWRPGAWRSAPWLTAGSVLWTSPGALAVLIAFGLGHLQVDGADFDTLIGSLPAVAALIACVGVLLALLGLEEIRPTSRTTWPRLIVVAALAWIAWDSMSQVHATITWFDQIRAYGGDNPTWTLWIVESGLQPVAAMAIIGMAWATFSAVRANEKPRALWKGLFAGSAAMAISVALTSIAFPGLGSLVSAGPEPSYYQWVASGAALLSATGAVLLTSAFLIAGVREPRMPLEEELLDYDIDEPPLDCGGDAEPAEFASPASQGT
jgi:hypothetical protein